jgi:hypothetical protein
VKHCFVYYFFNKAAANMLFAIQLQLWPCRCYVLQSKGDVDGAALSLVSKLQHSDYVRVKAINEVGDFERTKLPAHPCAVDSSEIFLHPTVTDGVLSQLSLMEQDDNWMRWLLIILVQESNVM